MTKHYEKNAESIVEAFKAVLGDDAIAAIGDEGFGGLKMLVEAGIADMLLQNMESVADRVTELAQSIRQDAEHFDDN